MEEFVGPLIVYGYWILFAWVLLDQLAAPVPAMPMILVAGALAGEGLLNPWLCVFVVVAGCLPPNLFWYWLGKHHGNKVLTLLCMISLEPDTCINTTTSAFQRYGTVSLLFSKFVPGLQSVTPPLAGLLGVSLWRFTALNTLGTLLYAAAFLLPGYWAHEFIVEILRVVSEFGVISGVLIGGLIVAWMAWKFANRQLFLRSLRGRRIQPADLHGRLTGGEPVQVADLRQRMEFNAFPYTIPGAVRVPMDLFNEEVEKLARNRPLVLFCT